MTYTEVENSQLNANGDFVGRFAWGPQSNHLLFAKTQNLVNTLYTMTTDPGSLVTKLFEGYQPEFSSDGRFLVYAIHQLSGQDDIYYAPLNTPSDPTSAGPAVPLLNSPALEGNPRLSPNGEWLAFAAGERGMQIYLTRFPSGEGRWEASPVGASQHRWDPSGDKLYYIAERALWEVKIETEPTLSLQPPRKLFEEDLANVDLDLGYCITRSGRILAVGNSEEQEEGLDYEIVVVQNWFEEFRPR